MSLHRLCPTLLATALLAACSTPHTSGQAGQQPATEAQRAALQAAATAASAKARDTALPAPPPPPPPQAQRVELTAGASEAPLVETDGYAYSPAKPAPGLVRLAMAPAPLLPPTANTEKYTPHQDNPVQRASEQPVSTFSIDVDTGSYTNVRRMLAAGERPPADAVRAEEFINYFSYHHPAPADRSTPFRVTTELAPAPWNPQRQLLMVGIQGYQVPAAQLPPANLVFLIDTSGSMDEPDKLPLLKQSLALLVPQLRAQDRVSIVVYAGSAGLVLPPTPGDRHGEILAALDRLQAGGSTNGGDGIALAYAMARQAYAPGGVNRVILATDGDFNVGTVNQGTLETLVGDQRKSGIALTTLGFGTGNYNDALSERLADVGDGNHAYIDSEREARRVLVQQMQGTLFTIARDVKIQVEFNPAQVAEYRLIGYENRVLRNEDFANDKVDAGDIGAGHQVTALYELTLAGSTATRLPPLRYGQAGPSGTGGQAHPGELAELRLRYKLPGQDSSRLVTAPVLRSALRAQPSGDLQFAAAVAGYADLLRDGAQVGAWTWQDVARTARAAGGDDAQGRRAEFAGLVERASALVQGGGAQAQDVAVAR